MPTIIATLGAADANSFQEREELDAYLTAHPYGAVALARSNDDRDAALILAAMRLSAVCYEGTATGETQSLPFPRTGLTHNGWAVASTVIPLAVKQAQAELARLILLSATSDPLAESEASAAGLTKLKAGSIELGFRADMKYEAVPKAVMTLIPAAWLCQEAKPQPFLVAM